MALTRRIGRAQPLSGELDRKRGEAVAADRKGPRPLFVLTRRWYAWGRWGGKQWERISGRLRGEGHRVDAGPDQPTSLGTTPRLGVLTGDVN